MILVVPTVTSTIQLASLAIVMQRGLKVMFVTKITVNVCANKALVEDVATNVLISTMAIQIAEV